MTTARLLPPPYSQFYDNSGNPLSGGKVYFYLAGTTTKGKVYKDPLETARHKNPIELDDSGRAVIYLVENVTYDMVVKSSDGSLIYNQDKIRSAQTVYNASTHEEDVGFAELDSGSIVESITSSTSVNINLGNSSDGGLNVKNLKLATDAYFTSPHFYTGSSTYILDSNGNELLKLSTNRTTNRKNLITIYCTHYTADGTTPALLINTQNSVANISKLRLLAKGSGYVYLNGYRFPNTTGTAGQKLQTNGSKVLSWV